jgi:hypothetical protein
MTDGISRAEYWREIAELAASVTQEAFDGETEISDVLHETIDGHEWVIYTRFTGRD